MGLNEKFFKSADEEAGPLFNTVLYTGNDGGSNNTTQAITGVGFATDLVWIKNRDTTLGHYIFDSVRGDGKELHSNDTSAQIVSVYNDIKLDSDGFTTGTGDGTNKGLAGANSYVAWCWKAGDSTVLNEEGSIDSQVSANVDNGFSIVKFTTSGGTGTVGHGLNVKPDVVLMKRLNTTSDWYWFYNDGNNLLRLNTTAAKTNDSTQDITSTTFKDWASTGDFIAYCFHSVAGVSKVGSYVGNGNNIGPVVSTGFEPSFILIKASSRAGYWIILDNKRNTSDPRDNPLYPNTNWAEDINQINRVNFDATGFQVVGTGGDVNDSGHTYIYYAIAAFDFPRALEVFYLLVAGGGGGGNFDGGGGGAGGLLTNFGGTGVPLSLATDYEIRVGNGGAGGQKTSPITTSEEGAHTSSDIVSNLTALGGGGGGNDNNNNLGTGGGASDGGSGGGSAEGSAQQIGFGTSGQGFNGGTASSNHGGGGGGAGEAGNTDGQGHGGDGLANAITGTSIFYAGGGGGDFRSGGSQGGSGGGADGSGTQANNGTNHLGGGGGARGGSTSVTAGRGGSGVAIFRYPDTYTITEQSSTDCSITTTTDGNDKVSIFKYTGSATVKQQGVMVIQFS